LPPVADSSQARRWRIGLDATAAVHQAAGIGRYVRRLAAALAAQHPHVDLRLFVAGAGRSALPPAPGGAVYRPSRLSERTHARLWHRLRLPLPVELWIGPLDLFHAADFALPPTLPAARTVLTVPDLAFERYPGETMPGMLDYLRSVVPRSVRRADRVIAISEATRDDLITLYGTPPDKVIAVPLGVDARFGPDRDAGQESALRARLAIPPGPFVLTVGTMQPRKNHRRLVEAMARLRADVPLVIAGGSGWGYDDVRREVERLGMAERVIFAGFVDDADLPTLYRAAAVFAYPALYEGFGLPVLEAMACGTPVVTSRVSSLPEVAGEDAALLVDPLDVDAIAGVLDRLLGDGGLRARCRERGIERAATFTWERTARETWAVYESLLVGS
jgi:glycosyltransferase involved in cell wall biosynthesis